MAAAIFGNMVLVPIAAVRQQQQAATPRKLMSFNRQDYELDNNNVDAMGASNTKTPLASVNKNGGSPQQKQDSPFSWRNVITMALQFAYKLLNPSNGLDKSGDGPILKVRSSKNGQRINSTVCRD
jgi:hypothetical protein